jgi:transposase-like protein
MVGRQGGVSTQIVQNPKGSSINEAISPRVAPGSVAYSDGWVGYRGLTKIGFHEHVQVLRIDQTLMEDHRNLRALRSFWEFVRRRFGKFRGVRADKLGLHIKECEFRRVNQEKDIYQMILKMLRDKPLTQVTSGKPKAGINK